jgi:hypothetical protein
LVGLKFATELRKIIYKDAPDMLVPGHEVRLRADPLAPGYPSPRYR